MVRRIQTRPRNAHIYRSLERTFGAGNVLYLEHHEVYIVSYRDRRIGFDSQGHHIATGPNPRAGEGTLYSDRIESMHILRMVSQLYRYLSHTPPARNRFRSRGGT